MYIDRHVKVLNNVEQDSVLQGLEIRTMKLKQLKIIFLNINFQ